MAKIEATVEGYVMDIAKLLENKKAENVVMINITKNSDLAEWFVLATALNTTHAKALCDELEEKVPLFSAKVYKREGQGDWIVLDLGDVIVHVFTQEIRNFYHLEKLWSDGKNEFTILGIEKALEKEKKKAELEEKKIQKVKEKEEQKKLKSKEKELLTEKAKEKTVNEKNAVKADKQIEVADKKSESKTETAAKKKSVKNEKEAVKTKKSSDKAESKQENLEKAKKSTAKKSTVKTKKEE